MKIGGPAPDPTAYHQVVEEVFAEPCLSPFARVSLGGKDSTVLTERGRSVRLALLPPPHADLESFLFTAPVSGERFRSLINPEDTLLKPTMLVPSRWNYMGDWQRSRLLRPADDPPSFTENLAASQEEREEMESHCDKALKGFRYDVFEGLPNLHAVPLLIPGQTQHFRRTIESTYVRFRQAWIDVLAPMLWSLIHRRDPQDFLILDVFRDETEEGGCLGYMQFKGCAGKTDAFGRHWVYGESKSALEKRLVGEEMGTWHATAAHILGWRSRPESGNDFGLFYVDGLFQVALLAELVVDSLVLLHGLTPSRVLKIRLTPYTGGVSIPLTTTFGPQEF